MSERSPENESGGQFVLLNRDDGEKTPVEGTMKVGRGLNCELVLSCTKCSRVHAEIGVEDGELWVEDQGSTNGTFVNDEQIDGRTPLEHGDFVQFGDSRFRVIDVRQQPPEDDADKTVVASREEMRGLADPARAGEPEPESVPESSPDARRESGAAEEPESAEPAKERQSDADEGGQAEPPRGAGGESEAPPGTESGSERAEAAPGSKKEGAESRKSGESNGGIDPSIPRSWADAEQLEQASHTSVLVMDEMQPPGKDSPSLDPSKAIAQARQQVSKDQPILIGLTEPVLGTMFELSVEDGKGKWEIGRGEGADIEIDADSVSGRHSQLVHENGRWKIVNMMSVNGTFVNERKVLSAYLQPGDVIRMGSVKLAFDARVKKSRSRPRAARASRKSGSGLGRVLTAPFRWIGRLFSRGER